MLRTPGQWMTQQQQAGRRLCLILEGNSNARQPLMAPRNLGQCCSLYGGSAVAALAADGPVILLVEQFDEPALVGLLEHPEMNWGWLGSLPDADLGDVIEHWQARMLVGPPGNQALYRFHDNRTLGRALTSVPVAQWPAYLGPLISVCYWHEEQWCCANNPAPGKYPIPDPLLGSTSPTPGLGHFAGEYPALPAGRTQRKPCGVGRVPGSRGWLAQVLDEARSWQWYGALQLEFWWCGVWQRQPGPG